MEVGWAAAGLAVDSEVAARVVAPEAAVTAEAATAAAREVVARVVARGRWTRWR